MRSAALFVALLAIALAGCDREPTPDAPPAEHAVTPLAAETYADSVALRAYDFFGGHETWTKLPYLRFDFGNERDGTRSLTARHFWDRMTGDYRVEMPVSDDSVYVALFNTNTREGQVYLNGEPVAEPEQRERLDGAYRRFINDTYWFISPTKLFDEGVTRTFVPDSSTAETDVLKLTFGEVGLTPGDTYWFYIDKATGRVDQWKYHLQGWGTERPASTATWEDYQEYASPAGPVTLAQRKRFGDAFSLLTDEISTPDRFPEDLFTDPGLPEM